MTSAVLDIRLAITNTLKMAMPLASGFRVFKICGKKMEISLFCSRCLPTNQSFFSSSARFTMHQLSSRSLNKKAVRLQTSTASSARNLLCNKTNICGVIANPKFFYSTLSQGKYVRLKPSRTFQIVVNRTLSTEQRDKERIRTIMTYVCTIGVTMVGMAYAGVPLYRMFCQASGLGGQAVVGHDTSKVEHMVPVKERNIKVKFNADTASSMRWNFRPQQTSVTVLPGETALAFYQAKNPTPKPIIGISTYNVIPFEAGQYFNKIQCFCFEEQRLNPNEEIDMPVFFYIDPEYAQDPKLQGVDTITLSYTFFEAKEGLQLPMPGQITPNYA